MPWVSRGDKRRSSGGYLHKVLTDGAKPFRYREGVSSIIVGSPREHVAPMSVHRLSPLAFQYATAGESEPLGNADPLTTTPPPMADEALDPKSGALTPSVRAKDRTSVSGAHSVEQPLTTGLRNIQETSDDAERRPREASAATAALFESIARPPRTDDATVSPAGIAGSEPGTQLSEPIVAKATALDIPGHTQRSGTPPGTLSGGVRDSHQRGPPDSNAAEPPSVPVRDPPQVGASSSPHARLRQVHSRGVVPPTASGEPLARSETPPGVSQSAPKKTHAMVERAKVLAPHASTGPHSVLPLRMKPEEHQRFEHPSGGYHPVPELTPRVPMSAHGGPDTAVEQLRRALQQLVEHQKVRTGSASAQSAAEPPRAAPPQVVRQITIVHQPMTRRPGSHAFWERSHLGRVMRRGLK